MFWNNIGITKKMAAFSGVMLAIITTLTLLFMSTISLLSEESQRVEKTGALSELMLAREIDHLNWIHTLQRYVFDPEIKELSIQTDPRNCGLGKWFFGEGREEAEKEFPTLKEKLRRLDAPHAALHASASDIAKLKAEGRLDEARRVFMAVSVPSVEAVQHILKEVTENMHAAQRASSAGFEASVSSSRKQTLIIVGASVLIALIMSLVLAKTVTNPIQRLAQFADTVAGGDFSAAISMPRRDELGSLAANLQRIPEALNRIMDGAGELAGRVQTGDFGKRIDVTSTSGDFKRLASSINTVSDAYTHLLDVIPLPIMSCDLDMNIKYLNEAAQNIVGGNKTGGKCGAHLRSSICGAAECCGMRSISRRAPVDCETAVEPCGKRMDVKFTAVPVLDAAGKPAGFIELFADLTDIKNTQRKIQSVAAQAAEISNRVAAASEELSAQVEQVSRGAEMQRTRVESTASAMSEMNSTVMEVARNASQASGQSELTKAKANDGSLLVNNVVKAIQTVETTASSMQATIQGLGQQAESIGEVINVISDIADQTNLLALNAAIEAARAGEAGRGFAVVADEVRKLAEKTMSATHKVGSSISAIQDSTQQSISAVNKSINAVQEATELAGKSGQALGEIVELAATTSSAVTSIATAAEEQSATSEEINVSVEQINQVVGETSQGMTQASAAVRELSKTAQELNQVMGQLRGM